MKKAAMNGTETAGPHTLDQVINDALGRWADDRAGQNLSRDTVFGPVRADAATAVHTAVVAWLNDAAQQKAS